jgi:hypothetical protein
VPTGKKSASAWQCELWEHAAARPGIRRAIADAETVANAIRSIRLTTTRDTAPEDFHQGR